ncbi:cysteine/serine-rich nuclear protein 2-like isoform X2 [Brienomyrus brachyistius]|uniref:cysteine/serine-rich nuclear protein 2-like isoform X2 n=1 Tax=Brienomyrus brachyistius TaxID=42636 RepID=UPI0020B2B5AB|nr:cysteine/serine-rich nuclear protein 2-like isoform X2 [Brienomyrus brachyistius]
MDSPTAFGLQSRFEEMDSGLPCPAPTTSDDDVFSSDSADSCDSLHPPSAPSLTPASILRQHRLPPSRKSVRFDAVTVYYFSRRRGVTSMPGQGSRRLSMAPRHSAVRHYTLGEITCERDDVHRRLLRPRLRQGKLRACRKKLMRSSAEVEPLTEVVSRTDVGRGAAEADEHFLLRAGSSVWSRDDCGCSQTAAACQLRQTSFPCWNSCDGYASGPLFAHSHCPQSSMKKGQLSVGMGGGCEELSVPPARCRASATEGGLQSHLVPIGGTEEGVTVADHEVQRDTLALENKTAVLHLQSAEELERKREQEEDESSSVNQRLCVETQPLMDGQEDQGVGPVDIQEGFPPDASVLCFTETQACASAFLNESPTMVYYQIGIKEPSALVVSDLHVEERNEQEVVGKAVDGDGWGQVSLPQDFNGSPRLPLLGGDLGSENTPPLHPVFFQELESLPPENVMHSEA